MEFQERAGSQIGIWEPEKIRVVHPFTNNGFSPWLICSPDQPLPHLSGRVGSNLTVPAAAEGLDEQDGGNTCVPQGPLPHRLLTVIRGLAMRTVPA